MADINTDRLSGKTCTTIGGRPILWKGHLCEGANLTPPRDDNFCLWTRCKAADVPANAARAADASDVTCPECAKIHLTLQG